MTRTHRRRIHFLHFLPVLFPALALVMASCSSSSEVAARKAAEASAFMDNGNLDAARKAALASVKARDDISANWILLGRIQLASGLVGDGYVSYTRALELDATNIEAMQLVAEIALQVGRFRDAEKAADQVLALQPDLPRVKLVKGFVALSDGKLDVAGKLADEVLRVLPTDDGSVVLKARVLGKQGKYAEAEKLLNQQLVSSKSEIISTTLVEVQRAAHNGSGLAAALKQLVQDHPTNDRIFDLAGVLYKIGKSLEARAVILERLEARKDDADYYADATAFLVTADPEILDAPRIAKIAQDGSLQMRELAARVLLASNRPQDARQVLEPVFNGGTGVNIHALYATSLARTGGSPLVPAIVADVLRRDETNVDALQLRARLKFESGDEKGALADAALVSRDNPSLIVGRMIPIDVYLRRGDKRRVRQLFEENIRGMPKSLEMLNLYIRFLTAEGDRSRTLEIASGYADLNPSRVKGWDVLRSLCRDDLCKTRAATGRAKALTLFPPDEFAGKKPQPGLFGPL